MRCGVGFWGFWGGQRPSLAAYVAVTGPTGGAAAPPEGGYDAFGPARMFWDTDITRPLCRRRQCVTLFSEELPWLRGRDLELVMGRAVCDWLGWRR